MMKGCANANITSFLFIPHRQVCWKDDGVDFGTIYVWPFWSANNFKVRTLIGLNLHIQIYITYSTASSPQQKAGTSHLLYRAPWLTHPQHNHVLRYGISPSSSLRNPRPLYHHHPLLLLPHHPLSYWKEMWSNIASQINSGKGGEYRQTTRGR